jgi:hypothetical protein
MAIESINVGNLANDGTGDDLREAFIKVNNNFVEVDNRTTTLPIQGENLGVAGEGVFAGKNQNTLEFKKIVGGANASVTSTNNSLIIDTTGGLDDFLVLTDNGHITIDGSAPLGIQGGDIIETRSPGTTVFIDLKNTGIVAHDINPTLSSHLKSNGNNIENAGTVFANSFAGPLTGLVHGVDIREINKYFDNNWDFGAIIPEYSNAVEYLIETSDIDMGSFIGEDVAVFNIDLGFIA